MKEGVGHVCHVGKGAQVAILFCLRTGQVGSRQIEQGRGSPHPPRAVAPRSAPVGRTKGAELPASEGVLRSTRETLKSADLKTRKEITFSLKTSHPFCIQFNSLGREGKVGDSVKKGSGPSAEAGGDGNRGKENVVSFKALQKLLLSAFCLVFSFS